MRKLPEVTLVPFTHELLPVVRPWFRHPEVVRRLGGPDWPERELRTAGDGIGETVDGLRLLRVHSWVALDGEGKAVAKVGGDVYDRWSGYDGPAMALAYVVDPRRWGQGFGTAALRAVFAAPEVADVVLFAAGIEPDNVASSRCATAAGMVATTTEPDDEGMICQLRSASATPGSGSPRKTGSRSETTS